MDPAVAMPNTIASVSQNNLPTFRTISVNNSSTDTVLSSLSNIPPEVIICKSCKLFRPNSYEFPRKFHKKIPSSKTIWVGGLPTNATNAIIHDIFGRCGIVTRLRKKNHLYHIRFKEEKSVEHAIALSGYRLEVQTSTGPIDTGVLIVDYLKDNSESSDMENDLYMPEDEHEFLADKNIKVHQDDQQNPNEIAALKSNYRMELDTSKRQLNFSNNSIKVHKDDFSKIDADLINIDVLKELNTLQRNFNECISNYEKKVEKLRGELSHLRPCRGKTFNEILQTKGQTNNSLKRFNQQNKEFECSTQEKKSKDVFNKFLKLDLESPTDGREIISQFNDKVVENDEIKDYIPGTDYEEFDDEDSLSQFNQIADPESENDVNVGTGKKCMSDFCINDYELEFKEFFEEINLSFCDSCT